MRFSVNKDDPGYQNYQALKSSGAKIEFLIDGEPVNDVAEADDVIGYAKVGEDQKRIRGKVEIRISQPEPQLEPEAETELEPDAQPEPVEADVDGE